MKKLKRACAVLASLILACFMLGSCSANKLPEGFVEEDAVAQAKELIKAISDKDYDAVVADFSDVMAKSLDADGLKEAFDSQTAELGVLKEFKSTAVGGGENDATGKYATVVIICSYENGSATYTISIDSDGKICGLYRK